MRISYRIDAEDRLVAFGESWEDFARANEAPELCKEDVLQRPLWSFVSGQDTVHLYQLMLEKVRADQKILCVPFRCDAPDLRRFLTVTLRPRQNDQVDFICEIQRCEIRNPIAILDTKQARGPEFITMCSFCKNVACEDVWFKLEDAIASMHLFERDKPPRISHGACPTCFSIVMDQLDSNPRSLC
jgi:hypothetical protein